MTFSSPLPDEYLVEAATQALTRPADHVKSLRAESETSR